MSKRARSASLLADDDTDIRVHVEGREEPIPAHHDVLKLFSRCVKDLPRATDGGPTAWDLRALVLEGESLPVAAEVVESWLDLVYSRVDNARRITQPCGLTTARPLLLFADAVGTSEVVMEDICRLLLDNPKLAITARVGEGPQLLCVRLALRGRLYTLDEEDGLEYIDVPAPRDDAPWFNVATADRLAAHHTQFAAAVGAALEEWLYLAGRLRLVPLARLLVDFTKAHLIDAGRSIFGPSISAVLSPRVMQCMPPELLFEGFTRDVLTDRPATVRLNAANVKVYLDSPLASAWLSMASGSRGRGSIMQGYGAQSELILDSASVHVNVVCGGWGAAHVADQVGEVVAKALAG